MTTVNPTRNGKRPTKRKQPITQKKAAENEAALDIKKVVVQDMAFIHPDVLANFEAQSKLNTAIIGKMSEIGAMVKFTMDILTETDTKKSFTTLYQEANTPEQEEKDVSHEV